MFLDFGFLIEMLRRVNLDQKCLYSRFVATSEMLSRANALRKLLLVPGGRLPLPGPYFDHHDFVVYCEESGKL